MRFIDKACAWLVVVIGVLHLAVGHSAFTSPNAQRIWFASAGFLLIVTGLANVAAQRAPGKAQSAAALAGSMSILIVGGLIGASDPQLLRQPQTLLLLAIGLFLTIERVQGLVSARRAV